MALQMTLALITSPSSVPTTVLVTPTVFASATTTESNQNNCRSSFGSHGGGRCILGGNREALFRCQWLIRLWLFLS